MGCQIMAVVDAFGTLTGTTNAGMVAYFRATGCTAVTVGDVIPVLAKTDYYENEYIIGQMKIWDTGSVAAEPNNCAMVRVIVYADGWICAWFDKESVVQSSTGSPSFIDAQTLGLLGGAIDYIDQWNGAYLKVSASDDSECPVDATFTIRNTDSALGQIQVHADKSSNAYHFNTGKTYTVDIYQSNGNLVWWGHTTSATGIPTNLSNRLYRAIYEMWEVIKDSSNTTDITDTAISKAFLDDGGVFTDDTTDFNDDGANDCPLMPVTEVVNDAFYYGHSSKFNGLNLNIGQAAVGTAITWEYWNGAWTALSPTDNTSGYTSAGANTVLFSPPADWVVTTINVQEKFWVRARVSTASFTTQPLLTQGWVRVADVLAYSNANLGLYSFEDTSALFCLICGISSTTAANVNKYFYNTPLLAKTIYNHVINYGGYSSSGVTNNIILNDTTIQTCAYIQFSNGYKVQNIESLDYAVGIQNVFSFVPGAETGGKCNIAAILITN